MNVQSDNYTLTTMHNTPQINKEFDKLVRNKFNLFNSLFLNLPYPNVSNVGILIPLLQKQSNEGLEAGKEPLTILDTFFDQHTAILREEEKIDFMFRIIQYVERQVVLYDSLEDAAFEQLLPFENIVSLKDYLHLLENRTGGEAIIEKLNHFSSRLVFTAHPTQFYPPSVLDIIARLKDQITRNDINEIDLSLQQLGLTSLMNAQKPSPLEEARNIIYILRNVYYDAVLDLYSGIKKSSRNSDFDNPGILQFGFWPGGDRDGNPYVTAETTVAVADELRLSLLKSYYGDLKKLEKQLTFRRIQVLLAGLRDKLYDAMFDPEVIIKYEEIIQPLAEARDILQQAYNSLYIDDLDALIDKVRIFKTHFASLDIRQNHRVHQNTILEILKKEGLVNIDLDELKKEEFLDILLNSYFRANADDYEDELVKDTMQTIARISAIQEKNGEAGCNRYIISNSEDIYSVLYVFSLLRWVSFGKDEIPMDIIPLFESMDAMANAEAIMRELFETKAYRKHLKQRGDVQTIMLGFSDGTKDGGYLKANWSIYQTKEKLSTLCDEYGIKVIFFDGRGGPPARGGGKTHRFYASQGKNIANHAIQLTIQGQTITSKYGTREHFIHNCEQLLTAALSHYTFADENNISKESRKLIDELAQISFEKYTALKNHEKFIPYLEKKSTLKYYSRANIGSRPSKRGDKQKLDLQDLRAISFVGSWSQLKQNVPGYFGLGTAIKTLIDQGKLEDLRRLFREVPFFKALILNSMMALKKSNFELTAYISKNEEFGDFWNILHDEYELSKQMTLLISEYSLLMEEDLVSRKSIEIREQIVLPLLLIQQYALQKIEKGVTSRGAYEKIVQRSLYGNINASRNSA